MTNTSPVAPASWEIMAVTQELDITSDTWVENWVDARASKLTSVKVAAVKASASARFTLISHAAPPIVNGSARSVGRASAASAR
jgi:hypothetical protein